MIESSEHSVQKGPFWLVDSQQLIAYPVDVAVSPVPSHKTVWPLVKGRLSASWNYYPRGRVEIRGGRAIVFANPICIDYPALEEKLRHAFSLSGLEMEYKADNSAHYSEGVFTEDENETHTNKHRRRKK